MKEIILPYIDKNHKLFKSNKGHKVDDYDFNKLYTSINHSKNKNLLEDLNGSLEKIIIDCKKTLNSTNEKLFLDEIHYFSKKLLVEDFRFYKTSNKRKNYLKNGQDGFIIKLPKITIFIINLITKRRIKGFQEKIINNKLKREDLSINGGIINQIICLILNINFSFNGVNRIMSKYMGYRMHVAGCSHEISTPKAAWWKNDFSTYGEPPKTAYYHYDESLQLPKAIIYLTDVNIYNGPVKIINNSKELFNVTPLQFLIGRVIGKIGKTKSSKTKHLFNHKYHQTFGCENFVKYFNKLPDNLKYNSHFGWDVIPNSDFESEIMDREKVIIGDKGTALIFDGTKLLHRGGLIEKGERIVLQVIFEKKERLHYLKKIFNYEK